MKTLAILLLLLTSLAPAQERSVEVEADTRATEKRREPTAAERNLGAQMLEPAVAEARGLEHPAARALMLQQLAAAYEQVDKVLATELLVEAFHNTQAIEDENDRREYQNILVQKLIARGYDVEQLAAQADPKVRGRITGLLVAELVRKKDYDRAQELLAQIDPQGEFPYGAAGDMMRDLPAERAGERHPIFALALDHYRRELPDGSIRVGRGFDDLITGHWRQLPPKAVLEAIDLVLDRARKQQEQSQGRRGQIAIAGPEGALSFGSIYEFKLFQMLPILKQLDSGKAERLTREAQGLAPMLDKYPEGMASLMPPAARGTPPSPPAAPGAQPARRQTTSMSMSVTSGGPPPGADPAPPIGATATVPELALGAQAQGRAMQLVDEARTNPKQAIAAAAALPEKAGPMSPRASALLGIANALAENEPSHSKAALDELQALLPRLDGFAQYSLLNDTVRAYIKLGEQEQAKKTIELGMKLAKTRFESENDPNDPNQAIKPEWQSTNIWRQMLAAAAEISPEYALRLLREVPDKEVQLVQKVALASLWLGAERPSVRVVQRRKDGGRTTYVE